MWLFEVHDDVRPGFRLSLRPGRTGVSLGYDEEIGGESWLPVGSSIDKWLRHPDDQDLSFGLRHANLEDKNIGLCLTEQTAAEAARDDRALVLIEGCIDAEAGFVDIADAHNRPAPSLVTYASGNGHVRKLYLFKPGDSLYVNWSARALNANQPKRFIITWDADAKELLAEPLRRPHRGWRSKKRQQRTPRPDRDLHP